MTITPLPVAPAGSHGRTGASGKTSQPGQGSEGGDFAALLDAHLVDPVPVDAAPSDTPSAEAAAPDAAEVVPGSLESMLAGSLAQPATTPAGNPGPTDAVTAEAEHPGVTGAGSTATVLPPAAESQPHPAPAARPGDTEGTALHPSTTGLDAASGPMPDAGQAAPSAEPAHVAPRPDGATDGSARSVDPGPQAATDVATAMPGAGPAAPSTVAAAPGAAEARTPATSQSPLLDQVTPVLSRVVSRGDGEHRMMLKLHPADLGEVHLTVTVRGDQVDVEIAAGAEAREVLRDGAGQLRSLLESIGRSTGQLVFRDLSAPSAPTPLPGSSAGGPGPDGRATTYEHGDHGHRDGRHDSPGPQRDPRPADRLLGTDPGAPRAFGRSRVPGGPALDVTV